MKPCVLLFRAGAIRALALLTVAWTFDTQIAVGQGSAFTYQGRLDDNGQPANGIYDLRFAIYDLSNGGNAVAGPLTNAAAISNGLFTVTLDFGANFPGADRWLEIAARASGGGPFVTLSPRQKITATPYAITARNVTGVVPNAGLSGTYGSAVTFNNAGNSFSGNGAGLNGVNAATLGGVGANQLWRTTGNAGTTPAANFVGTTDNQPLELRANGQRGLRLQPFAGFGVSVVGGSNFVDAISPAATIAGGLGNVIQSQGFYSTIGGGRSNVLEASAQQVVIAGGIENRMREGANSSAIGGGWQNVVESNTAMSVIAGGWTNSVGPFALASAVGGGYQNSIQHRADYSLISGGRFNRILMSNEYATISGGGFNQIQTGAERAAIGGGFGNTIETNAASSVIAGGGGNRISADSGAIGGGFGHFIESDANNSAIGGGAANGIHTGAGHSTIAGGLLNRIGTNSFFSAIGGGNNNQVRNNATRAVIAGGTVNEIQRDTENSTISGGQLNTMAPGCSFSTIGGGKANSITNQSDFATIPGGGGNIAGGHFSFAAGREAHALHHGTFVWADFPVTNSAPFASTSTNQFLIRAAGGVGINTPAPQAALHVAGNIQMGIDSADYRQFRLGGGNSEGFLYGSFLRFADGIHLGYNYFANASGGNVILRSDGATSRITAGYGFVTLAVGGVNAAPTINRLVADTTGVTVFGTFNNASDRNAKQDFKPVDPTVILAKVARLPLSEWSYKDDATTRHIGPMAQDFHAAFAIGTDDRHIAPLDEGGVALAAIQGLNEKIEAGSERVDGRIQRLEAENVELKRSIDELKALVNSLARKVETEGR